MAETPAETYLVCLRAKPSGVPAVVRLKQLLKVALRRFGLEAVSVKPAEANGVETVK